MPNYSCIIVDDEPLARKVIIEHVNEFDELELKGEFKSAIEARVYLEDNEVDIIFLDINMPKLSGMELLKYINSNGLVIFTTAYPKFAVDAFEHNAFDYLVKPISFDRFLKSIDKVKKHLATTDSVESNSITIKENKRLYKIQLDEIFYLEAYGDYVKVHTSEKMYTVKKRLTGYEKILKKQFIRIHRSYIINLDKIDFVEGNQVSISGNKIPISSGYKDTFISRYKT